MNKSNKIVLICTGIYTPGGIERAIVNLSNLFVSNGIDTTLLILDTTSESFYDILPQVKILQQNLHFGITTNGNVFTRKIQFARHIWKLRKLLTIIKPTIVISTEYSLTIAAFLAYRKKATLFSWEHHHFYWVKKNAFWQVLFNIIYPKVDTIVCLNKTEASLFSTIGCKTTIIPNFTTPQLLSSLNKNNILTIGWLINRKGVDLIPDIAERVKKEYPHWHWQIIGEGPLKDHLEEEIIKRDLKHFLSITPPASSNLSGVYLNTSLYVMTSRFECFPMVLLESMSYGIPCVAFDCPTGPSDIIHQNIDGILVKNGHVNTMASAIVKLIEDVETRKNMGVKAYKNVQRFSPDAIFLLWKNLLEEM